MSLEELTGQTAIIRAIQSSLKKGRIISVNIKGVSGSGKSWLLNTLSVDIAEKGGCNIKLQGERDRASELYYPLTCFLEQKNKAGKRGTKATKKLISEIPIFGSSAEALLEDFDLNSFTKKDYAFSDFGLNKQEHFATHLISLLAKYETLAVICDDLQDFDTHSLTYIDNLIKYLNSKSFTASVVFIFCLNSERDTVGNLPSWLSFQTFEYQIKRIERPQLTSAMVLLGLKNSLNEPELDVIYSATGGHLHVLRIIVSYLNQNHEKNLLVDGNNLFNNLLEIRLQQFQHYYSLIKELLFTLSGIGTSGSKIELLCLLDNRDDLNEAMQHAVDIEFITLKDGYLHFTHEAVKNYVTAQKIKQKPVFYKKLSNCLRALSPSSYLRRAWAEAMSGNLEKADIYRALYIIQRMRLGQYAEAAALNAIFSSEEALNMQSTMAVFQQSYQFNAESNLNSALLSLSTLSFALPQEIFAEKVYLECEVLLKQPDLIARKEALNKLESWDLLKAEEPEQWYRFSHLKLLAYAEQGNFDLANKTEQEIAIFFTKRLSFDNGAKDILNRLNLFSEIVYSPDIAHIKLSQTYHNLKVAIENEHYDKLIDYYISLCNLSGNCITTNRLQLSQQYSKSALDLIKVFTYVSFPHKEVAVNNLLLASHFLNSETPQNVISAFTKLNAAKFEEDGVLINSNLAGILVQQNRVDEAHAILVEYVPLLVADQTDFYYYYYHRFNYAVVLYLLGQKRESLEILQQLGPQVNTVNNKLSAFYLKHFEVTVALIKEYAAMDYSTFCTRFSEKQPRHLSQLWHKFQHVFLFSDLQIWTNN